MSMQRSLSKINHSPPEVCSLCGVDQLVEIGAKDFGHSGNDHFTGKRQFPSYGTDIAYHRCGGCHLVFTGALDFWAPADFRHHIYNEDYLRADPPFEHERSRRNAALVAGLWDAEKTELSFLDFGGGNGAMAEMLRAAGMHFESCDPFHGQPRPSKRFDVVTCFEVLEHVPHAGQLECFRALASHLKPGGTLLLSTRLLDAETSIDHWYLCPRNGHVTVHSDRSLARLASLAGFDLFSINNEMHLFRPSKSEARDWVTLG